MGSWLEELRAVTVDQVAGDVGVARAGRRLGRCPACGADRASNSDGRAPLSVDPDRRRWKHWGCGAAGDAADLVALALTGARLNGNPRAAEVRAWFSDRGLCSAAGETRRGRSRRRRRPRRAPHQTPTPQISAHGDQAPGAPKGPPPLEAAAVRALWGDADQHCDDGVATWLKGRGLCPDRVRLFDLARSLPEGARVPRWAHLSRRDCGDGPRRWTANGYRLLVPMFDHAGRLVTLQARHVGPGAAKAAKAMNPHGGRPSGRVFACPLARLWLAGAQLGDGRDAGDELARVGLVVAEGIPDFLTWATEWGDAAEDAPAVVGIVSGSWTVDLAVRVPEGARLIVATHNDEAGDRYADTIAHTPGLLGCQLGRWTQPRRRRAADGRHPDSNDLRQLGEDLDVDAIAPMNIDRERLARSVAAARQRMETFA